MDNKLAIKHKVGDKIGECEDLKKASTLGHERATTIYNKACER